MNIWLINHYAVPPSFYPLARTTNFAKYLMRDGHSATVFAASSVHNSDINLINDGAPYREETVDGVHYVFVRAPSYRGSGAGRIINMFDFAHRLKNICGNFDKPDALLSSSATPPACMAGLSLAKKYGCRGVAEVSDLWPESFVAYGLINGKNPLLRPMYRYERKLYERADAVIFTMEGGAEYVVERGWDKASGGPVDMSKVFYINNGVDLEAFDNNLKNYVLPDPDLDDNGVFKAVYAGSVGRANSLAGLADAAGILEEKAPGRIKLLIYGDGRDKESLARRCLSRNLSNIVFKGGVDKKYIPSILSRADLNVFHVADTPIMRYGVSPNKLFDYFASGKPILSDVVAGYDLVERYGAGTTIGSHDPESIADAVLYMSRLPKERLSEFGRNARRAAGDFDFKVLTEKLATVLTGREPLKRNAGAGEPE